MRAAIVSAVIAALCLAPVAARPAEQGLEPRIDALFSAFDKSTPGCALGVQKNGRPVFSKGYGMADLEHGVPITPKTMFYMASVSKQFTALTVLMLAKEHRLALTDSVRKYIPELPAYADKITLYHLLTHTSGVRDYLTLGSMAGLSPETTYNDDGVVRMLARQQALNFEPGTRFLYSNSGYVLLSIVVKRVMGKPLDAVSRAYVFAPLGMTTTLFHHDHTGFIADKASGYQRRGGAWAVSNSPLDVVGDGGLYSSVDDMFHWMGNFDAPKVGADSLKVMETPATLGDGKTIDYGMGLTPAVYRGLKVIDHSGALAGYRTEDMWFPSQRLAVVVLCNSGAANPVQLAAKIADLYLTDVPEAPSTAGPTPASAPLADRPEVAVDPKLLDAYAGDYELRPGFIISFARDNDHLVTRATGQGSTTMYAVSDAAFRLRTTPAEVDFDRPTDGGKAQGAVLHQNGATLPMKRVLIARPTAEQLKAYDGKFYSAELDATYEVSDRDGGLHVHYAGGDLRLEPIGKDMFAGAAGGLAKFVCGDGGPCGAFTFDDGRALNLKFVRTGS